MKKTVILMLGTIMVLTQACAQNTAAPAKVTSSFSKKFPTAKNVKWDKENATEWEAEFKMNGEEYSANFNNEGTWLETEYEIEASAIPEAVKKTLASEFSGYDIEEVELSETAKGKVYEFSLEKDETDMEVAISPEGKVIKKEVKKENDKEDKD